MPSDHETVVSRSVVTGDSFEMASALLIESMPRNTYVIITLCMYVKICDVSDTLILRLLSYIFSGNPNSSIMNMRARTNNTNRIAPRLWNCGMAACLIMVNIVRSIRAGNGIPPRFRRGEAPGPTKKSKDPK
ncbi:uncharacterized protein EV154DRAFT_479177 [Mucor mucedo]|uniref:uncharacterized protein n=1 Tax=Mucor mucedo TaxID=29922 RepID=UPI00221FAB59|nr:uncharacterized protein EV154DRAFT_479177 [Mucor mucedo]KAI7893652.1 hypothetical protein EV154DRAFT_479177 [Mucor mucedo]